MSTPLFQHRHFAWLADWAKHMLTESERRELARDLRRTNSRFDDTRVLAAAGVEGQMNGRDRLQ